MRRAAALGALLLAAAWARADGSAPTPTGAAPLDTATAHAWVESGERSFQAQPLRQAAAVLAACAGSPGAPPGCASDAARAYLYLSYVLDLAQQGADARACLGPATRWAQAAVAEQPDSARAHALLAEVYGRRVLLGNPFTALRFGPLNGDEVAQAVRLDPRDPEVLFAQGLRYLYAPALFGGSPTKAQACLTLSMGRHDSDLTRYFLGLALQKLGHPDQARQQWLTAQRMNPGNGMVREALDQHR